MARLTNWLRVATLASAAAMPVGRALAAPAPAPAPAPVAAGAPKSSAGTEAPSADPAVVARYDSLFGSEEKQVAGTATTKDDARFANELVARLKDLKDDPALTALVCERAYAFGSKDPDGYRSAIEAARRLRDAGDVTGGGEWRGRLTELYQLQFKRVTGAERAECGEALLGNLINQAADESEVGTVAA